MVTTLRSNKRVRFEDEKGSEAEGETADGEDKRRKGAEARERNKEYADAVQEEENLHKDGVERESRNTGGSASSGNNTAPQDNKDDDDEAEEGRSPEALWVPEGRVMGKERSITSNIYRFETGANIA